MGGAVALPYLHMASYEYEKLCVTGPVHVPLTSTVCLYARSVLFGARQGYAV